MFPNAASTSSTTPRSPSHRSQASLRRHPSQRLDRARVPSAHVIHRRHRVAAPQQRLGAVRPDESRAARHQRVRPCDRSRTRTRVARRRASSRRRSSSTRTRRAPRVASSSFRRAVGGAAASRRRARDARERQRHRERRRGSRADRSRARAPSSPSAVAPRGASRSRVVDRPLFLSHDSCDGAFEGAVDPPSRAIARRSSRARAADDVRRRRDRARCPRRDRPRRRRGHGMSASARHGVDHQAVVGVVKRLTAANMVVARAIERSRTTLTAEGERRARCADRPRRARTRACRRRGWRWTRSGRARDRGRRTSGSSRRCRGIGWRW